MAALCVVAAWTGSGPADASARCPWMSKALRPSARASKLLAAMSTADKLALLTGVDTTAAPYADGGAGYAGYVPPNPRLCIPALTLNDGPAGVADGQIGTTAFPAPLAQAATWDPVLEQSLGAALGWEAWQKGIDVLLGPNVNIARVPENGRNFEAFGEDPFLSSAMAVADIDGIQQNPVIATVKHFPVNSQETNRYSVSENLDERTLREIYLPPFVAAVEDAKVGAVMCAYGLVNVVYSCQDPNLMGAFLRKELRFDGIVVSDWNATRSAPASAAAGLDLVMPTSANAVTTLASGIDAGTVTPQLIDGMVTHVLTSMFRLGLFDDPPPPRQNVYLSHVSTPADEGVALQVAEEGTVLLKNAAHALPLHLGAHETIAVVGAPAGAATSAFVGGGGSAYVTATNAVTPLQALTTRAAKANDDVTYADGSDAAAAAAAAGSADAAVVFVYDQEREGYDRADLELPAGQDQLVEAVARANPHTIVVLDTGGPVLMPWLDQVAGVVEAWYPGDEDGNAIAAVLFGDAEPGGRLPQTFPTSDTALPTASPDQWPGAGNAQDAIFSEGIDVGYRWYDATKIAPLFPFGFGLSYTTFRYLHLKVKTRGSKVTVAFTVENTGRRAGTDVPQLYLDDPRAADEPPKQLAGFERVDLQPREATTVTLTIPQRSFAYWNTATKAWTEAPGLYRILVGASSRDIRLRGFVRR
ncbi:MAG: glycoside hydrolase family 3 C-terminal domain-containing protein [Actinobacteria bacterium]|nr:glycoside hydrolase family 3 C-terminal domain-containing protein [Actinomycetota bacterium]